MKKSFSIFLVLLMGISSQADEFYAYCGGGISKGFEFGGLFGVGYTYFFTPNWGIGTGLEKAFYNVKGESENYNQQTFTFTDYEGNEIEFRSTIKGYKEEQSFTLLQIPLMVQYQNGENHQFYARAGAKLGIPIKGKNKITADSIKNTGYRKFENYEYTTQTFLGFGTFVGEKSEQDLPLQTAVLLSAEAGMKWKINKALRLYTGLYFDYGLNSVIEKGHSLDNPIEYKNEIHTFVFNNLIDELSPFALGLKLNLTYSFSESKILK